MGQFSKLHCPHSVNFFFFFFADDSIIFSRASSSDIDSVKGSWETYEVASGQKINMEKPAISFSPNVGASCKTIILSTLGLNSAQSHDKYLGPLTWFVC